MACDEGHGHRVDSRRRVLSSLPTHLLSPKAPVPHAYPVCLPLLRLESVFCGDRSCWRRCTSLRVAGTQLCCPSPEHGSTLSWRRPCDLAGGIPPASFGTMAQRADTQVRLSGRNSLWMGSSGVQLHRLESGVAAGTTDAVWNSASLHATVSDSGLTAHAMRQAPAADTSKKNSGQLPNRRTPSQPSSQTMRDHRPRRQGVGAARETPALLAKPERGQRVKEIP